MAVKSSVNVTAGLTLPALRGEKIGEVVEDGIAGSSFNDKFIQETTGTNKTDTQVIISYTPTIFGTLGSRRVLSALSDYYNKVTGSALQTTDLSEADLLVYLTLAKEWRLLIKVIDKLIDQYNLISSTNASFGKWHIDAVFGNGAYDMISKNSANVINARNELADLINRRLLLPAGSSSYHFEEALIDKTFIDDPNGKGCLIDFKRCYNDPGSKDAPISNGIYGTGGLDPATYSNGWPFYLALGSVGKSEIFTTYFRFDQLDSFARAKQLLDKLVLDTWYKDVQPYITHMTKNIKVDVLSTDKQLNKTGEWSPVYSPDVLAFIRNAHYVGKLLNTFTGTGDSLAIYEDETTGYIIQGHIKYYSGEAKTLQGLQVACLAGGLSRDATNGWQSTTVNVYDDTSDNVLLNLEDYPANGDMIRQAVYGLFTYVEPGDDVGYTHRGVKTIGYCGPILFNNINRCVINPTSNLMEFVPMCPTAILYGTNAAFIRSDVRVITGNSGVSEFATIIKDRQYNFTPVTRMLFISTANMKSAAYSAETLATSDDRKAEFICHDVDSLVYYDIERLKQNLKEISTHSMYDPDSVTIDHPSSFKR